MPTATPRTTARCRRRARTRIWPPRSTARANTRSSRSSPPSSNTRVPRSRRCRPTCSASPIPLRCSAPSAAAGGMSVIARCSAARRPRSPLRTPIATTRPHQEAAMTEQQPANAPAKTRKLLRRGILVLAVAGVAVLIGGYYALFMRDHATTDDAYVNGNLVRLTPQIAGTVVAIDTDETQYVRRGQVLVELDPRD